MANKQIWDGTASFSPGDTPFGFYDSDITFQTDAQKVAKFVGTRLGYPLMDVELQQQQMFACFEEAITTYGNEVFTYKIRENYLSLEGSSTGSLINNQVVDPTLTRIVELSKHYGTEAGVGGNVDRYTGSIDTIGNQQNYDLDAWAIEQGIEGGIEIRKIFYEAPPAIMRYFDPYAGTGTGVQSLMTAFDFGGMSPGVNFLMMPTSYDVLKTQAIEFNDQIRKSTYSFEIVNNKLKLFPIPSRNGIMNFEYYKNADKSKINYNSNTSLISNVGEVPYTNPEYYGINSVGRQWIFNYTLALAKEVLGYIRGKYATVPVPGAEATLNQADLLADARAEKTALLLQLRETLTSTGRSAQLEAQAKESEDVENILKSIPMTIYVG
ncbi:hypothetical protein N9J42_00890 [bacterium]|nr:hypothetical protein [bacterium]